MRYVGIADLKARLSHHLKSVRRGETLTVRDRDTPVARIVPIDTTSSGLVVHPRKDPRGRLCDVPLPPPSGMKADIVGLLLEERGDR